MHSMPRNILILLLALSLVSCSANATPTPEPESMIVKLSWRHGVQFLGYYIAQQNGFYAEENLIVQIEAINDPSEIFELANGVASGTYDFSMNSTPLIAEQVAGAPVITIATILQVSPQTFFTRADRGINSPADFAGLRVAVTADSTRNSLEGLLQNAGLTLDDVEVVPSGFDMTPFYEGDVDVWVGYLTNEVIRARQQGLEITTFPSYEYGIRTTEEMIFTRSEIVENHPDLAVRFLRATLRGWQWAVEHPSEAVEIMLEMFPDMAEDREFHQTSFSAYIPLIQLPGVPIGSINCDRWLANPGFEGIITTDGLCTPDIFDQAVTAE